MAGLAAFFCVAAGGALGSLARFGAQLVVGPRLPGFPWAVLLVNLAGSFLIGVLAPLADRLSPHARPLLITGVLGGFTTMSSFAFDVVSLIDQRRFAAALLCWGGGALATLAACALGYVLASSLKA